MDATQSSSDNSVKVTYSISDKKSLFTEFLSFLFDEFIKHTENGNFIPGAKSDLSEFDKWYEESFNPNHHCSHGECKCKRKEPPYNPETCNATPEQHKTGWDHLHEYLHQDNNQVRTEDDDEVTSLYYLQDNKGVVTGATFHQSTTFFPQNINQVKKILSDDYQPDASGDNNDHKKIIHEHINNTLNGDNKGTLSSKLNDTLSSFDSVYDSFFTIYNKMDNMKKDFLNFRHLSDSDKRSLHRSLFDAANAIGKVYNLLNK